ncbi:MULTISPECIES: ATP-binding protein [Enterobacterales]|uniref:ATP-binding protein n=1 Tax=Enterobacterales TaxID=91347 RepID=UPI0005E2D632|nr:MULTISPECIES: ATP-binding protein [Enterobacterales]EKN3386718.1 ATP-binding protein [Yersinia enterocolitica]EKN3403126.1 ATP-binding protein [Yersinia enterocolitica]EKN3588259.1 ATP-binding protein [Yersinia enterocolitica]EKN3734366.1 ATP-binding protein [Yersinia enterocolitica]EKN3768360.1 ATP-binding protein [Yersinia enterocolitica]
MALFTFNDDSYILGNIREVDTRKVTILVNSDKDLRKARVGQLVTVQLSGATECWLIGMIDKVIKAVVTHPLTLEVQEDDADEIDAFEDSVVNTVKITLMGGARWDAIAQKYKFSRSLDHVPEIDSTCYILKDAHLEEFMRVISECGNGEDSLELGSYKLNENARAYVDGNKLFQRHAALLGSTGSGKSWTVASILERSSRLPSSNLVVFDLHGEYKELSYAKQLRIPGPDEVNIDDNSLLFLPYWLLNSEEIQSLFVDRSEFSAHNQVVVVQDAITEQKKAFLQANGRTDLLQSFTLDSPIPYSLNHVIEKLKYLNEEKVDGSRGPKNGPFNGEFSRLLVRMASRLNDRRYGFLFDSPDKFNQYDSLSMIAEKLMEFGEQKQSIKVIDFSEVPADILPVIIGLVARIIYQVQFWTDPKSRRPVAFVCDEAHLYLPRKEGNPVERRAVEAFEKIAKEGRKYGVALMIVSQRPSDVSATILSQCNNIISLRLTNADDQATVRKLLPESLESLLEALPIMDVGEAMVVGDSVLLPSRIKIDPPTEKPLSATIDFWSRWQENVTNTDFALAVENMRRQNRTKL